MAEKIRILLADDHQILREGLKYILEAQPDMIVAGEVADGRQAVKETKRINPDVVLMDIAMPELNGIEATLQIRQNCPSTRVIILSMHSSPEHIFRSLKAGANGYLLKEAAGKEVVSAVRSVYEGRRYLSQRIDEIVIENYLLKSQGTKARSPLEKLTSREREILQLVVEGRTSLEISKVLALSPKTVETYRSRLMEKLGLHDIPSLVKFAISQGFTGLE